MVHFQVLTTAWVVVNDSEAPWVEKKKREHGKVLVVVELWRAHSQVLRTFSRVNFCCFRVRMLRFHHFRSHRFLFLLLHSFIC